MKYLIPDTIYMNNGNFDESRQRKDTENVMSLIRKHYPKMQGTPNGGLQNSQYIILPFNTENYLCYGLALLEQEPSQQQLAEANYEKFINRITEILNECYSHYGNVIVTQS